MRTKSPPIFSLPSGAASAPPLGGRASGVAPLSTWSMLANPSAFQAAHPVANPDLADFEPDGTWYSME
jgi:hypothetical protein